MENSNATISFGYIQNSETNTTVTIAEALTIAPGCQVMAPTTITTGYGTLNYVELIQFPMTDFPLCTITNHVIDNTLYINLANTSNEDYTIDKDTGIATIYINSYPYVAYSTSDVLISQTNQNIVDNVEYKINTGTSIAQLVVTLS